MRGEGRNEQRTEAGLGHNGPPPGVSQAVLLQFIEELDAADQKVAEAVGSRKDVRKRAKGVGFNMPALDRARKLANQSGEKREAEDRELRRYMAWLLKPLGYQSEMFAEPEAETGNGLDLDDEVDELQARQISDRGFAAGKAGLDRIAENRWSTGSLRAQIWDSGWMQGQEALAQSLEPPEPTRRPGRPKGSRDRQPRTRGSGAAEA